MKKKICFLPAFLLLLSAITWGQTKRALVVAIGQYEFAKTKWKPLNVNNDVLLIQESLKKQEFPEANITLLRDKAATRAAIVQALDKLAEDAGKGDIVVIHFSSHGVQLQDDGVDEMDLLDEALVPVDAIYNFNPVHFVKYASGYIRDDYFGEKVTAIRNKIGSSGDLLVLLDACHSGTATRGQGTAVVRGGNKPMVSDKFDMKKLAAKDDKGVFRENSKVNLNEDAATYVVLSGARAQESNWETFDENYKPVGSLSYAFSKALLSLDSNTSYRGLFARIENIMREKSPKQKPVLEGDGIDRKLFGGRYLKQKMYFTINLPQSTADTLEITAGAVAGITNGSVVKFYPAGTADPAGKKPVATGKVVITRNFTAKVLLDKPDAGLLKSVPWAFLSELSYRTGKVKLKLNNTIPGAAAQAQKAFKDFQLVELSNTADLYLDTLGAKDKWIYKYTNSGIPFGTETFLLSDTATMKETLKRYDRFRYLQDLEFREEGLSARVELVFLDEKGNIDEAKMATRQKMTGLELVEGDVVYLKIRNTGDKRFFINIVDLQPDGFINPVLPNKRLKDRNNYPAPIRPEDCMVKAGDSLLLKTLSITIYKPYGEEMLKVFLSKDKLDLEDILTGNGDSGSRGPGGILNNMAKVFQSSLVNGNGKRGDEGATVNTDQNGTIFGVGFTIVPAR